VVNLPGWVTKDGEQMSCSDTTLLSPETLRNLMHVEGLMARDKVSTGRGRMENILLSPFTTMKNMDMKEGCGYTKWMDIGG
jgi:hypothetical protein